MQKSRRSFWKLSEHSLTRNVNPSHKGEWKTLFVAQAGEFAPRLKRVVFGKKAKPWAFKGQYKRMEMERIDGRLMDEMMKRAEGRKVLIDNIDSIAEQLADFVVENMNLGISHGEIKLRHFFVQKNKRGVKIKPFDYGMGSLLDRSKNMPAEIEMNRALGRSVHSTGYVESKNMLKRIIQNADLTAAQKRERVKEVENLFKEKFEEKIAKM